MCGIVGYISGRKFDDSIILESLAHRGPDDEGRFNDVVMEKNVFLGHKRLSILDLSSAGHQPMLSADGKIIIVYNGEVYNFLELKAKYLPGVKFNSNSDTEVILNLYMKFGEKFVTELNGDFAMAVLDKNENKILLYRDRLGVKPLYVYNNSSTLFFGSEIKPFLKSGLPINISEDELMNYFVFKYSPQSNTLINNISRLQPGHYLKYDIATEKSATLCYWKPSFETDHKITFDEAKEEVYRILGDAVDKRLVSDVPVGTFFSGGVDSSAIAWFLKNNNKITHYTARKNKSDLKEEGTTSDFDYAMKLARQWNLNLVNIDISSSEANNKLIGLTTFYSDDLIADGSQIPSYLITDQAAETSTVLLSGMGADEIFLGYGNHLLTLMSQYFDKTPGFINSVILNSLSGVKQGRGYFKGYKRFLKKIGKYYKYPGYRYGLYSIVGDFENSFKVMNTSNEPSINVFKSYFGDNPNPFQELQKFEIENFLVKNLHYLDRMCMANSVEGRVPFMDHRLVELAIKLPRKYKLSGLGKQKVVLKSSMEGKVPDEILYRRKAGFGMPLRSIFKNRENVLNLLDFDFLSSFGFFDIQHIKNLIDSHVTGLEDNSAILYSVISFQSWYKTHIA